MDIINWSSQLRELLDQLSSERVISFSDLKGDPDQLLLAIRDLNHLGLIQGEMIFGESKDLEGPLLADAHSIALTARGRAFIEQ